MFIYRRKTSRGLCKYWSVKFTGADGHQVLRSTKQQNKDKAREVALAWDKVARLALNGTLTHAASQALFKRASDRNFRREFQCSDGQRLFRILAGSQADNRQSFRHSELYQAVLAEFVAFLPERRSTSFLSSITALEIERFRNAESKSGKSATSVNLRLRVLRAVLNSARRH